MQNTHNMNVSIINIGDELLIGQVVNSNASTMSKMLVAAGMDVKETAVIADDRDAILSSLSRCLAKTDAVLITGGLGPTKDDITKKVLCEFFDSHLVENEEALKGYAVHPAHVEVANGVVRPNTELRSCLDFEVVNNE